MLCGPCCRWSIFGIFAVALTPNVKVAAVLSSNFYSLANLFAGFLAPRPTVPGWWVWCVPLKLVLEHAQVQHGSVMLTCAWVQAELGVAGDIHA